MFKKKVLYIHHGKGLGGAPISLLLLIKALDKKRYHPVVLFLHESEIIELYKQNNIEIAGIVHCYDFSHTKVWWFKWYHPHHLLRAIWDTLKTEYFLADHWLDKIKPDILHLNTSSLIAWGKVAHRKKIPVAWHIREPLASGYLGIRQRIVKKHVEKYSSVILPICKNDSKPWRNNSKLKIIYNAADSDLFNHKISYVNFLKKYGLSKKTPKILFLGGLSKEKGTLLILKAFQKVLEEIPHAQLLIAGYFDLNLQQTSAIKKIFPTYQFKKQISAVLEKTKNSINLLGPIKNVPEAMAASKIIVFPATVEHFARPVIEAGFMKKPVVASNLSPLDELVINGQTGYLIDPEDINLWSKKLITLLSNKNLTQKLGNNAYKFCLQNFHLQEQIKKIENIYNNLLNL